MNRKQSKSTFQKMVDEFVESNNSFSTKMQSLHNLLRHCSKQNLKECIGKSATTMIKIKWMILLNKIILQRHFPNSEYVQQLINCIQIHPLQSISNVDLLLMQKLIIPYKIYLQRRNLVDMNIGNSQIECYQIINIIRKALSFTDVIFTLGRYLYKENPFLVNFNLVIGKDLSYLYKQMRQRLTQIMCEENAEQLEKMNEGLYNVYYNCYFSKNVVKLAPTWLNTEAIFWKKKSSPKKHSTEIFKTNNSEVNRTIIIDMLEIENDISAMQQCNEFKSTSTLETNEKDKVEMSSRLQFITFAQSILQEIQCIQHNRDQAII